jgi:Domain of unknown function (DUF222)
VLRGELTPQCAAFLAAVLESLPAPAGADDERSRGQRFHDGLREAAPRLAAAGLLPERGGQPVRAWVHVSLAELRGMDEGSRLEGERAGRVPGERAAARAGGSVGGGDGAAWLEGDAARAACCDAALTPVVTGEPDVAALEEQDSAQPPAAPPRVAVPARGPSPIGVGSFRAKLASFIQGISKEGKQARSHQIERLVGRHSNGPRANRVVGPTTSLGARRWANHVVGMVVML